MPESATPDRSDTPAVALGPTALMLGAISAVGAWPAFVFAVFPWSILAGALSVTFGAAGVYYARLGTGRLWTAVTGAALGATGLAGAITFIGALGVQ
ncbi:hypothetical protein [Streptomyces sp. YKOK-I1]